MISFLRYLNFYPDFFRHLEECLDRKAKVNFKTYDISKRETNNCNIHIAQYLKKYRQSDNETNYNMRNKFPQK